MRKKSARIMEDNTFVIGNGDKRRYLRWWTYEGGWDVNLSVARRSARPADVHVAFKDLAGLREFLLEGLGILHAAEAAQERLTDVHPELGDSQESSPSSGRSGFGETE